MNPWVLWPAIIHKFRPQCRPILAKPVHPTGVYQISANVLSAYQEYRLEICSLLCHP